MSVAELELLGVGKILYLRAVFYELSHVTDIESINHEHDTADVLHSCSVMLVKIQIELFVIQGMLALQS